MPYATDVPSCPKCNGAMWDNREGKKNPKSPDFRCKDKSCVDEKGFGTGLWEKDIQKGAKPAPAPAKQGFTSGPHIPEIDGPALPHEKMEKLFDVYDVCLDHVLSSVVPKLVKADIGTSPESVGAMTATLLIQASKVLG